MTIWLRALLDCYISNAHHNISRNNAYKESSPCCHALISDSTVGGPMQLNAPLNHNITHVQRRSGEGNVKNIRIANLVSGFMVMESMQV